jgi:hypothetical protein
MSKADDYRERAAECLQQAEAATMDSVRDTLLDIAKKYLALAANEDRSAKPALTQNGRGTPPDPPG